VNCKAEKEYLKELRKIKCERESNKRKNEDDDKSDSKKFKYIKPELDFNDFDTSSSDSE